MYETGPTQLASCAGTITQSEAHAANRPVSSTCPAVHLPSMPVATRRATTPKTMVPPSTTASFSDVRNAADEGHQHDHDVEESAHVVAGIAEPPRAAR